ncbi:MAG: hypothetical protein QXY45_01435 [Candidatus Aenigmatarchaeota archaeon]
MIKNFVLLLLFLLFILFFVDFVYSAERIVGRVTKDGGYGSEYSITSSDGKTAGWDNNPDPFYYIGYWEQGTQITIKLNNPNRGYVCSDWRISYPDTSYPSVSGIGCSATVTVRSGPHSGDWQNHLWFYLKSCNDCVYNNYVFNTCNLVWCGIGDGLAMRVKNPFYTSQRGVCGDDGVCSFCDSWPDYRFLCSGITNPGKWYVCVPGNCRSSWDWGDGQPICASNGQIVDNWKCDAQNSRWIRLCPTCANKIGIFVDGTNTNNCTLAACNGTCNYNYNTPGAHIASAKTWYNDILCSENSINFIITTTTTTTTRTTTTTPYGVCCQFPGDGCGYLGLSTCYNEGGIPYPGRICINDACVTTTTTTSTTTTTRTTTTTTLLSNNCGLNCQLLGYNDATCGICPAAGTCVSNICRHNPILSLGNGPWSDCGPSNCCCFNSESCDCVNDFCDPNNGCISSTTSSTISTTTTTTTSTTTTLPPGASNSCINNDDCKCYESCEDRGYGSFCYDIRPNTSGCEVYDGCDGSTENCNDPEKCFPNTDPAVLESCEDTSFSCHVLSTCDM